MLAELSKAEKRFDELEAKLADPEIIASDPKYPEYLKEHGSLANLVQSYRNYCKIKQDLADSEALEQESDDPEMQELAREEIVTLKAECSECLTDLTNRMMAKEDDGNRNAIIELRAGTGGEESALFVGDLVRMYQNYCMGKGWKVETLNYNPSEKGGFKEITVSVSGEDVYALLQYESGTHRVQRVPETESQGRIHTSAVTVAVLPEVEDVEVDIKPEDVRKDLYCASGPGGQSVNTTYSAVRLTHIPTGTVVTCQDEKSQVKNAEKAMRVLRSRIYEVQKQKAHEERSSERREQIGSGDRSERIRTYNFPQNRLTDHRIGLTLYSLDQIITGEIASVIDALLQEDRKRRFGDLFQ